MTRRGRGQGPDRGDRRRGQGALRRGAGRHPGVPAGRAGDPRHRRCADVGAADRPGEEDAGSDSVVQSLERGRAAPRLLLPHRPPDRAVHQRRRDLPDRAGDPVRDRLRRRRISRYSARTKVQRLPIEPISQASANQRSVGADVSPRASRSGSTPRRSTTPARNSPTPRSSAPTWPASSSRWRRCGSARSRTSPFVEPPDRRNITAGIDLLTELGALATGEPTYRRRRNPQLDAQNPQVGGRNPQFG